MWTPFATHFGSCVPQGTPRAKKIGMAVRGQLERGIALDLARREIAARIRRVCTDFGDAEFAALVEKMAEIEVRYRLRADWLNLVRSHAPPPFPSQARAG